jgi:YD repeat-containing protein
LNNDLKRFVQRRLQFILLLLAAGAFAHVPERRNVFPLDAAHRLTSTLTPLGRETRVTYDARNRLVGTTSTSSLTYGYDPAGHRTAITNGAEVTRLVVNPNAPLSQVLMRTKAGVTNYYIYGVGLLYEITETATSTNTLTYHYDYRGSTVALSGDNGVITGDRIEYSA